MIETYSTRIAARPADVFAFLVDQENWPAMDPALVDVAPRGPLRHGATGTVTRRVSGIRVTTVWEIIEFDPSSRVAMCITGRGYQLTETTALIEDGDGTALTVTDVLVPTSLPGRVFVAMSGPFIRRDLRIRTSRLTTLLGTADAPQGASSR